VIKSQDNLAVCLTVSLQYQNACTMCTNIHNNMAYKNNFRFSIKISVYGYILQKKMAVKLFLVTNLFGSRMPLVLSKHVLIVTMIDVQLWCLHYIIFANGV
jgi:hypothetical protein